MGYWTLDTPPTWAPNALATESGWVDATTGELLVAIGGLATRRTTGATPVRVTFTTTDNKTVLRQTDVITVKVYFNEKVTVTGTPRIVLTIGGASKNCDYASGTGTNILTFTYTVVDGDTGNWTAIGNITLNGGTIKDTNDGTTNSVLTLAGVQSTSGYSVDNAEPTVGDVDLFGGARFATGAVMRFKVPYNTPVAVTGAPTLAVTIGANPRTATFSEVIGNDVYFTYTVVGGDSAVATEVVVGDITLNGGTIKDLPGNTAPTTGLAGAAFVATAFVNSGAAPGAPTISTVAIAADTYKIGDVIPVVATFSQRVAVDTTGGTPTYTILIDGVEKQATYASGSGLTTITFNYTVVEGDLAADGEVSAKVNGLALNGGTIKNYSLENATITKAAAAQSGVIVDGVIPTITSAAFTGAEHPAYVTDDVLELTLTFSEIVNVTGTPRIPIGIDQDNKYLEYASGDGTDELVFQYTVVAGDVAPIPGQGFAIQDVYVDLNGGTIVDDGGNAAVLKFRRPAITQITFNA